MVIFAQNEYRKVSIEFLLLNIMLEFIYKNDKTMDFFREHSVIQLQSLIYNMLKTKPVLGPLWGKYKLI